MCRRPLLAKRHHKWTVDKGRTNETLLFATFDVCFWTLFSFSLSLSFRACTSAEQFSLSSPRGDSVAADYRALSPLSDVCHADQISADALEGNAASIR